jgi:ribosomal protein L37AE/L43A
MQKGGSEMAKKMMPNDWIKNPPRCPLCHKQMVVKRDEIRGMTILVCETERIAINVADPLVGRWEERREDIVACPMPGCERNMRLFFTSVGFLLAKCPKCGAMVRGSNPDRFSMPETPGLLGDGVKAEGAEPEKSGKK